MSGQVLPNSANQTVFHKDFCFLGRTSQPVVDSHAPDKNSHNYHL